MITTEHIKELRDKTGVSIMQCKKALEEARGDGEKALVLLRKESSAMAGKKSDRALGAGTVVSYIHPGNSVGTLVLLSAETDFVAKNEDFKKLAYDIAMHIAAAMPTFLRREDVPEDEMKKIREALSSEVPAGKPKEIQERILAGKLDDYLKSKVLLEQQFIRDETTTIQGLLDSAIQKFGERVEVSRFVRFTSVG
ncbi:elongation factor Ts [bacterium]|nr:elongation factor Ts [bacterium]